MALTPDTDQFSQFLRLAFVRSPNFVSGVSGWTINQDGSAEFNNITIRNGQIISGVFLLYSGTPPAKGNLVLAFAPITGGTDSVGNVYPQGFNFGVWDATGTLKQHFGINASGDTFLVNSSGLTVIHEHSADGSIWFYNSSGEGAGNLVASEAPAAGTDSAGNHYIAGYAVYNNASGVAAQLFSNGLFIYTGSLAGGWTIGSAALNSSGDNWVIAANQGVTFPSISTPSGAGALTKIFADGNGFMRMFAGLAGDTNEYQLGEILLTNGGFTVNSATPQTIMSCPVGIGTYLIEVWLVSSNTTAADAAGWALTGPAAGSPQLVDFESKTSGTAVVGYGASATYTTTFNGQGTGGNQGVLMRAVIAFSAAGTLAFTGKELVAGNTVTVFGAWMRVRHVS